MAHRPKLVSAAKVLVYINGKLFGRVVSFQWNSITPRKKIHTIDIPYPVELAATITEVTWTMGVLRSIGDGGMQGAGVVADQALLSREKYFTILLVERTSNLTLFKADYCATDSESWQISAKSLMSGQVSGSGIIWTNEASTQ
jgi:hypothetical protein